MADTKLEKRRAGLRQEQVAFATQVKEMREQVAKLEHEVVRLDGAIVLLDELILAEGEKNEPDNE